MSTPELIVRPFNSPAEYTSYFRLANTAFADEPSEEDARRWLDSALQSPTFKPERIRGVMRAGEVLGGYIMEDLVLRMGDARISIGGIGAVVTDPAARLQGVGRALMLDALTFARAQHHALLLLDGIPHFYRPFGYIDMFDPAAIEINRAAILAREPSGYQVRPSKQDDAAAILALYQRTYGSYTGSFERTLVGQEHRLKSEQLPLVLAISPEDKVEGYLLYGRGARARQGREVAADNWQALLALLRYHAQVCADDPAAVSLQYFLPLDAPLAHQIIDTLFLPAPTPGQTSEFEEGVQGTIYHQQFAGWMGSLIDFPLLLDAILPELQVRWRRSLAHWSGEFALTVGEQTRILSLAGQQVQVTEQATGVSYALTLSPQALVQLVFGYRQVEELTAIAHLPSEAHSALKILFPSGHTWIARTDWF